MTTVKRKSPLLKKYVSILQTDIKPDSARPSFLLNSTPQSRNSSCEILERVIISRKLNPNKSLLSNQEISTPLVKSYARVAKTPTSNIISSRAFLTPQGSIILGSPNNGVEGKTSHNELSKIEAIESHRVPRQGTARERESFIIKKDSSIQKTNYLRERLSRNKSPNIEKEEILHNLYQGVRDVSTELEAIVSQRYQKKLENLMLRFQIKEFINLQGQRLANVLKVIEKNFMEGQSKESQLKQETWKIVNLEINKIKELYDNFLFSYNKIAFQAEDAKEKVLNGVKIWDAFKTLVEYSGCYRSRVSNEDQAEKEKILEDLKKTIYTYKLDIKAKMKDDVVEAYEVVEGHLLSLNHVLDAEINKCNFFMNENQKLIEKLQEVEERQTTMKSDMIALIEKKTWEMSAKSKEKMPEYQQKVFENKIVELEKQVKKLTQENERLEGSLRAVKEDVKKLNPKNVGVKTYQDKGVMINLFSEATQVPRDRLSVCSDLNISSINVTIGTKFRETLAFAMINLIYTDKIITDLIDDSEKRPRKPLNTYLTEWFLRRFGLYSICGTLMRDFIYTLKNARPFHDRFKTFLELIGINESAIATTGKKPKSETDTKMSHLEIRKKIYTTAECLKCFFKFISQSKVPGENTPSSQINEYGPFLPKISSPNDIVKIQTARNLVKILLREQNFSIEESEDTLDLFHILQQHSFYQANSLDKSRDAHEYKEEETVGFDAFVGFILDAHVGHQVKVIEHIYTSLRANIASQSEENLAYDEFKITMEKMFPRKSRAWREHAFAKFMDIPSANQITLHRLMPNLVDSYLQEDQVKEFYQVVSVKKDKSAPDSNESTPKSKKGQKGEAKQTLINYSKAPDHIEEHKPAFEFDNPALNDTIYHVYDTVSSLIALQEVYYILEDAIKEAEAVNESLHFFNVKFNEEISCFPKHFGDSQNYYKEVKEFKKKELVDLVENLWETFRSILIQTFRQK